MTPDDFECALTELGWTQRRLAANLGRHVNAVNDWACGRTEIPPYAIHHITTALELKRLQERLFPNLK